MSYELDWHRAYSAIVVAKEVLIPHPHPDPIGLYRAYYLQRFGLDVTDPVQLYYLATSLDFVTRWTVQYTLAHGGHTWLDLSEAESEALRELIVETGAGLLCALEQHLPAAVRSGELQEQTVQKEVRTDRFRWELCEPSTADIEAYMDAFGDAEQSQLDAASAKLDEALAPMADRFLDDLFAYAMCTANTCLAADTIGLADDRGMDTTKLKRLMGATTVVLYKLLPAYHRA